MDRAAHYDKLGVNDALLVLRYQHGAQARGSGRAIPAAAGPDCEERELPAHCKGAGERGWPRPSESRRRRRKRRSHEADSRVAANALRHCKRAWRRLQPADSIYSPHALQQDLKESEQAAGALGEAGNSPVEFVRALEGSSEEVSQFRARAELERALVKTAMDLRDDRAHHLIRRTGAGAGAGQYVGARIACPRRCLH